MRHRNKKDCLCFTGRNYVLCLESVRSSNTDHHHTRSAGDGNSACILVDFKAVHGCKLDLSGVVWVLTAPGASWKWGFVFQTNQICSSSRFPPALRHSQQSLGSEEMSPHWQDRRFLPLKLGEQRN